MCLFSFFLPLPLNRSLPGLCAPVDEDVLDAGAAEPERGVHGLLERDGAAAAEGLVRRQHAHGARVLQGEKD